MVQMLLVCCVVSGSGMKLQRTTQTEKFAAHHYDTKQA